MWEPRVLIAPLEHRRLLAAVTGTGLHSKLEIEGSAGDDVIIVAFNVNTGAIDVTVNGNNEGSFAPALFRKISIDCLEGNDSVTVASGRPTFIEGREGNDTLIASGGADGLYGGAGNDSLIGNGGNDDIRAGVGNDRVDGGSGDDTIQGASGDDLILCGSGNDDVTLDQFFDENDEPLIANATVFGAGGDDSVLSFQSGGSLHFDGGSGNDDLLDFGFDEVAFTVRGAGGDDRISVRIAQAFDISGGGGRNVLSVGSSNEMGVSLTIDGNANDGRFGDQNPTGFIKPDFAEIQINEFETSSQNLVDATDCPHRIAISGSVGRDTLIGGAFADVLDCNESDESDAPSNDRLVGNGGNDILRGGRGNDTLLGGAGADSFNGGYGNDQISAADGEADIVNGAQGLGDSATVDLMLDTLVRVENVL